MPVDTKAPTNELGNVSGYGSGLVAWSGFAGDDLETTTHLQWPNSIPTYYKMKTDAQIQGLIRGSTLPITQYHWYIEPNGARDVVVDKIAADLGLSIGPDEQENTPRSKRRFKFIEHLSTVLLALTYGHMFFEQVGEVREDGLWHLRKLAPRMPHSLTEIASADDGGLKYIRQSFGPNTPKIGVERLVAYVWEKEGANWTGRSMLRSCYGPWLIKDRVIRVGAINIERNGAGTPIVEAPPGATDRDVRALDAMAREFKAGERAGGAIPNGSKLRLMGVEGSQPDAQGYIKLMNEEMARSFLMMFMQLGQSESGSRALGSEFIDFFAMTQEAIATWVADIFNEHVIEDDVDWNWGEDEPAPRLTYARTKPDSREDDEEDNPVQGLEDELDSGLQVDEELEAAIRKSSTSVRPVARRPKRRTAGVRGATLPSPIPLPSRQLRRQPYQHEVQAAVDFAQMDLDWQMIRDQMVADVSAAQSAQIEDLGEQVQEADNDLTVIMNIEVEPIDAGIVAAGMTNAAKAGVIQAQGEAERQGIPADDSQREVSQAIIDTIQENSKAIAHVLSVALAGTAVERAIALAGSGSEAMQPRRVRDAVVRHLKGLTTSFLSNHLGFAAHQGVNAGRKQFMGRHAPQALYSSELLDTSTCSSCYQIDGRQYMDIAAAEMDYPTAGYIECQGFRRCRGTLVAVYREAEPTPEYADPLDPQMPGVS